MVIILLFLSLLVISNDYDNFLKIIILYYIPTLCIGESAIELALNSEYKELASKIAKYLYIHTRATALLQQVSFTT